MSGVACPRRNLPPAFPPFRCDLVNTHHFISALSTFPAISLKARTGVHVGTLAIILLPNAQTSVILSARRSLNGNLVAAGARSLASPLVTKMTRAFLLWTRITVTCFLLLWSSEFVMIIEAKSKESKLMLQQGELFPHIIRRSHRPSPRSAGHYPNYKWNRLTNEIFITQ